MKRFSRTSPRVSKALGRSDIDNEAVLAELDKDVEVEALQKVRSGERPVKSARLQALTSGGSNSFNSGSDEVTLASTYQPSHCDPIGMPHPTAPRSKCPRRQARKIDPSCHPLGPYTFQGAGHYSKLNTYSATGTPHQQQQQQHVQQGLSQLYSQEAQQAMFASQNSNASQQLPASQNTALPGGLGMHQMVLVQGPYGIQVIPAAAFAATPQGLMQLQRMHQAQLQAAATASGYTAGHTHAKSTADAPSPAETNTAPMRAVPAAGPSDPAARIPHVDAPVAECPEIVAGEKSHTTASTRIHTEAKPVQMQGNAGVDLPSSLVMEGTVVTGTPAPSVANLPSRAGVDRQDSAVAGVVSIGIPVGMPGSAVPGMPPGAFAEGMCGATQAPFMGMMGDRMVAGGNVAGKPTGESRVLQPLPQRQASAALSPSVAGASRRKSAGGRKASRPQRATA